MAVKVPPDAAVYEGRVAFHDCDPLGIVWHGNYYRYLEHGREVLLRRHRLDVPDFQEMGHRLLVSETRCRHAFPLHHGDRYRVSAWFIDTELRLNVGYLVQNLTHERRSARAWTVLVTTDAAGRLLLATPDEIRRRIEEERHEPR